MTTQPKPLVSQRAELKPCPFCGGEAAMQDDYLAGIMKKEVEAYCATCLFSLPVKRWNARPAETLASLSSEGEEYRHALLNLLAIIHRDGGQRTQELGWKLAAEQAEHISAERIAAIETCTCGGDPNQPADHHDISCPRALDGYSASTPSPSDVIEKCGEDDPTKPVWELITNAEVSARVRRICQQRDDAINAMSVAQAENSSVRDKTVAEAAAIAENYQGPPPLRHAGTCRGIGAAIRQLAAQEGKL